METTTEPQNSTGPTTPCPHANYECVPDADYVDMIEDFVYSQLNGFHFVFAALYAVVFIVGLSGNLLVCIAVWRNRDMRTVTNGFIMNLAIADLLVIVFCLPLTLLEDLLITWFLGSAMCKLIKYLQMVSVDVSILTLSFISLDRFNAICHPLKFKSGVSKGRNLVIGCIIWLIPMCIHVPELVILDVSMPRTNGTLLLTRCIPAWTETWNMENQTAFHVTLIVLLFFLPLVLMAYCYTRIACSLWGNSIPGLAGSSDYLETSSSKLHAFWKAGNEIDAVFKREHRVSDSKGKLKHNNGGNSASSSSANQENQLKARRNVAKMLITIVIMFAVCYLPVNLMNIFRYAGVKIAHEETGRSIALVSHWLCYLNSAVNPIIYNFMSATFKKEFRHACSCLMPSSARRRGRTGRFKDSGYSYRYTTQSSFMSKDRAESTREPLTITTLNKSGSLGSARSNCTTMSRDLTSCA